MEEYGGVYLVFRGKTKIEMTAEKEGDNCGALSEQRSRVVSCLLLHVCMRARRLDSTTWQKPLAGCPATKTRLHDC